MRRVILIILILALLSPLYNAAVYNAPCDTTDECHTIYTDEYICTTGHCIRKPISYPFSVKEVVGFVLINLVATIANAAGLGAGPVLVPVYMFLYGFVATDSIPLSKIAIFSGAVVNLIVNWKSKHPTIKNMLLINYGLATIMVPWLLAGTMLGVLMSKFLPVGVIMAGLITYLYASIYKIFMKALRVTRKEIREK